MLFTKKGFKNITTLREKLIVPSTKFLAITKLSLLVRKLSTKNAKFGLKQIKHFMEVLGQKSIISSVGNLQLTVGIPLKFTASVQKFATSCPAYFLTHDAANDNSRKG